MVTPTGSMAPFTGCCSTTGLGASHQTGWTGIIARLMHLFSTSTAEQFLELGKMAAAVEAAPAGGQTR